ncbi:MAG: hypothetical protein HYV63_02415 [Candidatus Schekmanbacteria bacterium]|nr:hypothetical protein [Candidatus Schekmanbacteria bacterium]
MQTRGERKPGKCLERLSNTNLIVAPMTYLDQPGPIMNEFTDPLAKDVHVVFAAGNNAKLAYTAGFAARVRQGRTTHDFGTASRNWEVTLADDYDPADRFSAYLWWNRPDLDLGVVLFQATARG